MRNHTARGFTLGAALVLLACSQDRQPDQQAAADTAADAATAEKPAPFDKGPVKIALVQYSGAGDYFQQWTKGAQEQADAVGFTMQHYDAKADDAKQAADMKTAIASGVAGIIVDHGRSPTLCPLINQATDAGIAVVVYDVKVARVRPQGRRDRAERRRSRHPRPHPDGQGHRRRRCRRLREPVGHRPAGAA